ncbi:hypothetical protein L3Q82_001405 [Scortum barcoo]|uniref:Uncharacterized protein n=1 Tax=Scortum barcoo TaxID=214431 RepID=A0ACB8W7H3_9TELE|nr:hypothetical protein L3Q82_001405 [Scortum barcoo]
MAGQHSEAPTQSLQKKARHIASDPTHLGNGLFVPLPSGKRIPPLLPSIVLTSLEANCYREAKVVRGPIEM